MYDKAYKRVCTKIAIAVLLNSALLQVFSIMALNVAPALEDALRSISATKGIDYLDLYYAVDETAALVAYLAAFMIPAFIFMIISRRERHEPMRLGVKLTADTPLVIVASVGVVLGTSYINSLMVSFVDFSPLYADTALNTPVRIIMAFISTAIVPAVCEEFLYRGCVLSNLLPYGKTTALIGSALLFALMHGNFAQFFYTFVAGLVLGAVYMETGSIWASTFIHLFNNFFSVIQQVIYYRSGQTAEANILIFVIDIALVVAGLALAGWLIYKRTKNGLHIEARPTNSISMESKSIVKGFFNPVMIVHIVLSVGSALLLVIMALSMAEM
ncbi:MAG: lysostaphin resistance A-like protein [Eubacteriales bacterium]